MAPNIVIAIKRGKESTLFSYGFAEKILSRISPEACSWSVSDVSPERWCLLYPRVMNAAAPEGTPPRRISDDRDD